MVWYGVVVVCDVECGVVVVCDVVWCGMKSLSIDSGAGTLVQMAGEGKRQVTWCGVVVVCDVECGVVVVCDVECGVVVVCDVECGVVWDEGIKY
ncbi:hypothetical protein ACOMHN_026308 [Nucella lapillus]